MNELLKQASDFANSLYGLPGDVILGLFALCVGYFIKTQSWISNKRIPIVIMAIGVIGSPVMTIGHYDTKAALPPQVLAHIMIGAIISLSVWGLHAKFLKKIEHKIPWLGDLLTSDPTDQTATPMPPTPPAPNP